MSNNGMQEKKILQFLELIRIFSSLASEECSQAVICQYVYPPCDGDGSPLLLTDEQCVNICDNVCAL